MATDDDDVDDDDDDDDDEMSLKPFSFSRQRKRSKSKCTEVVQRCAAWAWPLSLGAELFLMLAQVHRLCNAVLINAGIGSIGRICS